MRNLLINKQIIEKLHDEFDEDTESINNALLYLLSIYHNIDTKLFSDRIVRIVNLTKIVERDFNKIPVGIKWNIELFDKQEESKNQINDWAWVENYWQIFFSINPSRASTLALCERKMKLFFTKYPHIRADEVINATKIYTAQFTLNHANPNFLLHAGNFILKKDEGIEHSELKKYVDIYLRDSQQKSQSVERNKVTE